jgi:lauroyl/myristoyl acyltransferase
MRRALVLPLAVLACTTAPRRAVDAADPAARVAAVADAYAAAFLAERPEEAYLAGKGVIFATGHIGSWDLAGAAFAARGKLLSAPVETLKPA